MIVEAEISIFLQHRLRVKTSNPIIYRFYGPQNNIFKLNIASFYLSEITFLILVATNCVFGAFTSEFRKDSNDTNIKTF